MQIYQALNTDSNSIKAMLNSFHSCTAHFWYYQVFLFVQLMHNYSFKA